jgi:hemolysin III
MSEYIFPSRKAELANAITHILGILFSIAVFIVVFCRDNYSEMQKFPLYIFAASMFLLYLSSTIYHLITNIKTKTLFRLFDHINIYFLIAGSYTPFLLLCVKGTLGWFYFGVLWSIAVFGIFYKLFLWKNYPKWSLFIYIGMGWLIVFIIKPMYSTLPPIGWMWLFIGGLSYTFGTIFYSWKTKTYAHAVWHLFVLFGSVSHFVAVLYI